MTPDGMKFKRSILWHPLHKNGLVGFYLERHLGASSPNAWDAMVALKGEFFPPRQDGGCEETTIDQWI